MSFAFWPAAETVERFNQQASRCGWQKRIGRGLGDGVAGFVAREGVLNPLRWVDGRWVVHPKARGVIEHAPPALVPSRNTCHTSMHLKAPSVPEASGTRAMRRTPSRCGRSRRCWRTKLLLGRLGQRRRGGGEDVGRWRTRRQLQQLGRYVP